MRPWRLATTLAAVVLLAGADRMLARDQEGVAEAEAMLRRVLALQKAGKLQEAVRLQEKLVEKVKQVFGPTHLSTASMMNNLAIMYTELGQYKKAEVLFQNSLKIREAALGKDHRDVANTLNNMAMLYRALGRHEQAEPLYKRSRKIREAVLGKDHPDVALSLNNLATLYCDLGQYEKAEPLFQRSLTINEAKLGKDHPRVAVILNNLAILYKNMGQYDRAEPLLERCLKIQEKNLPADHPDAAHALHSLAMLYQDVGQPEKAKPLYLRSLKIYESKLGKDHPTVALVLHNLALLYEAEKQHEKAESLYLRTLEIYEAKLGKDHPYLASSQNNLGVLYYYRGQYDKAEPLLKRSFEIREARLGKDHPDVALSLANLAEFAVRKGEPRQAAKLFDRARRAARRHIAAVLPVLSDREQTAFFHNTGARSSLDMALSLGLANKADAELAATSAAWLLNAKALDQEGLSSSLLLARQSGDPALGKAAAQLLSVRRQLARLTLSEAQPGQEKQRLSRIAKLTEEEQGLGKQLRLAGSKAAPPSWVELADLQKALSRDAVLLDVVHFRPFDFKAKFGKQWQPARYAVWVTAKSGPPRLIDLGSAARIDAAVKQCRTTMKEAVQLIKDKGEEHAEKTLRENLEALAKLVLTPLLPHIGTSKHWLVSPDGNLWLLPWEALPLPDGAYAIEKHDVSYLTSGRDALPTVAAKVKVSAPLVMADPDFDLDPKKARAEAKRLVGTADEEGVQSLSGAYRLGEAQRLPGTAVEAKSVAPCLKDYCGVAPRVYLREQALEAVFKSVRHPRVVVLATHGFFLPDQEAPRDERIGPGATKAVRIGEKPLLRCGLLLAGCNNAAKATAGDDGVLTGLEVLGANLRGCELVVLSACETGLGEVQTGEGVSGLRQAFQLAGAKAVVSTLWKAPDQQSARLMTLFFRNLGKKMGNADALRAAKMQIIGERRDDYAAAHPLFWAAFTLTGEP